jgi:hypothetical protein
MMSLGHCVNKENEYVTYRMTLKQIDFEDLLPKSIHLIDGKKFELMMIPTWQADFEKQLYDCFVIFKKLN